MRLRRESALQMVLCLAPRKEEEAGVVVSGCSTTRSSTFQGDCRGGHYARLFCVRRIQKLPPPHQSALGNVACISAL